METTTPNLLDETEPITNEQECKCGETKCENGKRWKCVDIGGGDCIWVITNENC